MPAPAEPTKHVYDPKLSAIYRELYSPAEMARILRFYGRFFEIEVHILLQKRFCRR